MLKKVWFILVLYSVLMVSGCFGGLSKESDGNNVVSDTAITEVDMVDVPEFDADKIALIRRVGSCEKRPPIFFFAGFCLVKTIKG